MKTYILINVTSLHNTPVLGVYDSKLLAEKRKLYFEGLYVDDDLQILEKYMEYIDRD